MRQASRFWWRREMIWISIAVTFWLVASIALVVWWVRWYAREARRAARDRRVVDEVLRAEERRRENHHGTVR